jgi:Ion channel
MHSLVATLGVLIVMAILWEAFESIVLPRRVTRQFRFTRGFYRFTWRLWSGLFGRIRLAKRRESYLSYFGPLSLLGLLVAWAILLIFGFALVHWGGGSSLYVAAPGLPRGFWTDLYMSGTTFFTLGLGDVTPRSALAHALTVVEGGLGFGFLALVIGYLPITFQAFSRREVNITLLDARAGSPPSAVELLRRHASDHGREAMLDLLSDWERWSAELLESHLSYPVLCYFRSQHDNQNWLAALTTILDVCVLVIVGLENVPRRQAQLTFAIARHAIVDLAQIFSAAPVHGHDRLGEEQVSRLRAALAEAGWKLAEGSAADAKLDKLRGMYEPFVISLARYLHFSLPGWFPPALRHDNWQTSAWGLISAGAADPSALAAAKDDHF